MHPTTRLALALLLIMTLILGALADSRIQPGLDADRYSFAESLVERGTFIVSGSSMHSVDWIKVDGQFYSGKPPVMNFTGAGLYALLHHGLGLNFREHAPWLVRAFVWTFSLLPSSLTLLLLWQVLRRAARPLHCTPARALWVCTLAAITTLLPAYATVFTNHSLAMALLMLAILPLIPRQGYPLPPSAGALAISGFWATLSATIDLLPGTFFVFGLALTLLWVGRPHGPGAPRPSRFLAPRWFSQWLALAAGCLCPALLHLVLNRITLGTWTLPYLIPGAFDYEGSVFIDDAISPDYPQYPTYLGGLWHYILGHRGLVWYMPLMVLGAILAAWGALRSPRWFRRLGPAAGATVGATLATLVLVPKFSMGLAGGTYGNRHMLPLIGVVFVFLALLPLLRSRAGTLGPWAWRSTVVWGGAVAILGIFNPWAPQTMSVFAPAETLVQQSARFGRQPWAEAIASRTAANPSFGYAEYARHLWVAGHRPAAVHCLRESVRLDPERVQSWFNLGMLTGELGRDEQASDAFAMVVELEPSNAGAWANLSLALARQRRWTEAYEVAGHALELNPNSLAALTAREAGARSLGHFDEVSTLSVKLEQLQNPSPPPRP
jgi:hypothetical protein